MGTTPVVFDYTAWLALVPGMAGIDETDATSYFGLATMYVRNDGRGPIFDPVQQTNLLYLATAHVAYILSNRTNGIPTSGGAELAPPLVGRINSATEGSVSVASEMPNQPASAAWWLQSPYGAMVWQMLAPFRTMRYVPGPRRIYNPPWRYLGGPPGYW